MNESAGWYQRDPLPPAFPAKAAVPVPGESKLHRSLRENCPSFLLLSSAVGGAFAACFVKAGGWGINFFLYALVWTVCAHLSLRRLGLARWRRDAVWYAGILLLALSVFWTAN